MTRPLALLGALTVLALAATALLALLVVRGASEVWPDDETQEAGA